MTTGRDDTGRDDSGRFARRLEAAERDAEACRMKSRGATYQQISDTLAYGNRQNAHRAVKDALAAIPAEGAAELQQLQLDQLDYLTTQALGVLEREHLTVSQAGKIVRDDEGKLVLDDGPVLSAIDRLLRIQERRAKLMGMDAPARSRVEVVTEEAAQALAATLEAQLADLHATAADDESGSQPGDPGENR